jgi:hypothetical protein
LREAAKADESAIAAAGATASNVATTREAAAHDAALAEE